MATTEHERVPPRMEKRFRKALQRALSLTPVEGVTRVQVRKAREVNLVVSSPDVYKVNGAECYFVFGPASVEDANKGFNLSGLNEMLDMSTVKETAEQQQQQQPSSSSSAEVLIETSDPKTVDEKNIELVMAQGACTREKAVAALKEHDNDVVEAIMAVSSI